MLGCGLAGLVEQEKDYWTGTRSIDRVAKF